MDLKQLFLIACVLAAYLVTIMATNTTSSMEDMDDDNTTEAPTNSTQGGSNNTGGAECLVASLAMFIFSLLTATFL